MLLKHFGFITRKKDIFMKNFLYLILFSLLIGTNTYAKTPQEGLAFFNKYTQYANSYNTELLNMYSPEVKIIREVVKPTGETEEVIVPSKRFFKELKLGQKTAKLRRYKNKYRNVTASQIPNGIKITAERQPTDETYWLKMYQIIQDTDSGLKITEEMMQTKVQTFLKHKNKGG